MLKIFTGLGFGIAGTIVSIPLAMYLVKLKLDPLYPEEIVSGFLNGLQVGIVEEIVFRFILIYVPFYLGWLPLTYACIISCVLFGLGHIPGWGWKFSIVAFVNGVFLALSYIYSGFCILVPIFVHALNVMIWFGCFTGGEYK